MDQDFEDYLYRERVNYLNSHAHTSLISNTLVALFTAWLMRDWFDHSHLILWLCICLVCFVFLWAFHNQFGNVKLSLGDTRWLRRGSIGSFLVGLLWGLVTVVFFAVDNSNYIIWVVCLYTGYVSGALSVSFAYMPAFVAFAIGITVPLVCRMFYQDETVYNMVGLLSIFYVTMLSYVAWNMHRLYIRSVRTQFDNITLMRELAEEKEAVEKAVAVKDQFLASASHDLRQPLNAIGLFVDALAPLQRNSQGTSILEKIRLSLRGLNGMLHSLLDISKLDADAVDYEPNHISLYTLVAQLHEEYQAKSKSVSITNNVAVDTIVFADPTVLYRIVRNVLDNAVKYTPAGEIHIYSKTSDDHTLLYISDTGIGIPGQKIEEVFDEFKQLNNPDRNRDKGLGLGLAIVKRLCELAAIEINLDSELDQGTCVRLKICNGLANEPQEVKAKPDVNLVGRMVVIIDDEKDIVEGMQLVLSSWDCDVIAGTSPEQVFTKLRDANKIPDVVISDLRLADNVDGTNVIDAIRDEYNEDFPAILITGDTAPERIVKANQARVTIMYKPIESSDLKQSIFALLTNT